MRPLEMLCMGAVGAVGGTCMSGGRGLPGPSCPPGTHGPGDTACPCRPWAAQAWARPAGGDSPVPKRQPRPCTGRGGLCRPKPGPQERAPWLALTFCPGWPDLPQWAFRWGQQPCPPTLSARSGHLGVVGGKPQAAATPSRPRSRGPPPSSDHLTQVQTTCLSGVLPVHCVTFPGPVAGGGEVRGVDRGSPGEGGAARGCARHELHPLPRLAGPTHLASCPSSPSTPGR